MIQVSNLSKSYGRQTIFESTGFMFSPGERLGLVGRNGSGKSTLFNMILGLESPDEGAISLPSGFRVGHLEQHIRFTAKTVLDEGASALRPNEDHIDETYKVKSILHGLGFHVEQFIASPLALSGGFQVRLNLAKSLLAEPDLLLLDEPTNYLDIVSLRWLSGFLRSWPRQIMIITHDRAFMDAVTTHTMAIHRKKFIKIQGNSEKLYAQIMQDEELYEKARQNDARKRREVERFIDRFRAQANRARAVQSRIKSLSKRQKIERMTVEKDLNFSFNTLPFTGKRMLVGEVLAYAYPGRKPLFSGLDLVVAPGDRIGVIGENGAGKTTLLSLLAGELAPTEGTVTLHDKTVRAFFGQTNVERLNPAKTVEQEIHDSNPALPRSRARGIAGAMLFEGDDALKKVSVLSGGERARVMLGTLLVRPCNLLLLDEPSNHLDMQSVDSLIQALDEFEGAVVIVTHSEMLLEALANRLVIFDRGRATLFEGGYDDFLKRVGWSSEGPPKVSKAAGQSTGQPDAQATRPRPQSGGGREARRIRAAIIDERSRVLSPLTKRIKAIEVELGILEARLETDEDALVRASNEADSAEITRLAQSTHEARVQIDALFSELAEKTARHETLAREFAEKLGGSQA
jgi:ATP-binding cassette subfamily F protein 3